MEKFYCAPPDDMVLPFGWASLNEKLKAMVMLCKCGGFCKKIKPRRVSKAFNHSK